MLPLVPLLILQSSAKPDLDAYLVNDSAFEMRAADRAGLLPSDVSGDVYRGYLASRFDRPADAVKYLRKFVDEGAKQNQENLAFAYELLTDAEARLGMYKESGADAEAGLKAIGSRLTDKRRQEMSDAAKRAQILQVIPPQTADVAPFQVPLIKDQAKLNRVPIDVNGQSIEAVFDTGADLSVVVESKAEAWGLKLLPGVIPVDSITGDKVGAHLAELPELKFGKATFRHVVVLVMADKDLTFGPYSIQAIVGFPVIEALGRIEFGRDGTLWAGGASSKPSLDNLALKGLGPIVRGSFRGVDLTFTIDTGAVDSHFTKGLLERFPDIANADKGTLTLGGAGGTRAFQIYRYPNFELKLGGQTVRLDTANVLAEAANSDVDRYSGNLGQDIFRQFDRLVIDFRRMSFELD